MECYYKDMKIKFSKEVRAALRKFSKVDRSEYIEKAVEKQLAKDAQDPVVISRGTVEFFSGGGGIVEGSPVSDSDYGPASNPRFGGGGSSNNLHPYQKEWLMAREREGRISFSNRDQIPPSEVLDRSPVPAFSGLGPNTGGNASQSN